MLMDLVIAMVQYLDTETVECLYEIILPWLKVSEKMFIVHPYWNCELVKFIGRFSVA